MKTSGKSKVKASGKLGVKASGKSEVKTPGNSEVKTSGTVRSEGNREIRSEDIREVRSQGNGRNGVPESDGGSFSPRLSKQQDNSMPWQHWFDIIAPPMR